LWLPPVPRAPYPSHKHQPRRAPFHHVAHARALAAHDDRADETAERDPAPDAEASLPDGEDALPLRARDLVPARDVVVDARADDSGRDAPDRDLEHEVPVAAAPGPAVAGQQDAGRA